MNSIKHKRIWLIGVAALAILVIGAGIYFGLKKTNSGRVSMAHSEIGAWGPVELVFSTEMQPDSVLAHLVWQPAVDYQALWQGQRLRLTPLKALSADQPITLRLTPGALTAAGKTLRQGFTFSPHVRAAEVLFLSPVNAPEVWRSPLDGAQKSPISHTGGKVISMAVTRDGEQIAFEAANVQGGSDLWLVGRDGQMERKAVDCGIQKCTQPSWSPDGTQIAYSQSEANGSNPQIWIYSLVGNQVQPLSISGTQTGNTPVWSPDGQRLAFYDLSAATVRVFDWQNQSEQTIPSADGEVGSWSADGQLLIYEAVRQADGLTYDTINAIDFKNQASRQLLAEDINRVDYSTPQLSPDGIWLAVGQRLVNGPVGKQLWLVRMDGSEIKAITSNPVFSQAAYRWDAWGSALVFQRLELGSSRSRPQIVVWRSDNASEQVLAEDASQPLWLP